MLELINNIIYLQRKPKYKLLQSSKRTLFETLIPQHFDLTLFISS